MNIEALLSKIDFTHQSYHIYACPILVGIKVGKTIPSANETTSQIPQVQHYPNLPHRNHSNLKNA